MTLQEAKMFIRNANNFIEMFGENLFERAVVNYDVKDFSTNQYVPRDEGADRYYARLGYPVLCDRTTWIFEEYKGEWKREVRKLAREYRIPCSYQISETDLLKDCILLANPNMANYQMDIYHLDGAKEIYIKCDNKKSLCVPVKAIVEKNFSLVVDRHTTYHKGYYNTHDRKQLLDEELATLETETAKALRKTIDEGEPYMYEAIEKDPHIRPRTIKVSFEVVLDGTDEAIQKRVVNKLKYSSFDTPTNITIEEV
jgi:hypothetical protein